LLEQSLPTLHVTPLLHFGQVPPPQSVPVSLPFLMVSMHVGMAHLFDWQFADVQSAATLHAPFTPHFGQLPPQSTSVSLPFFAPSPQLAVWQTPFWQTAVSQSLPLPQV
jgi:hypothetical protein